MNLELILTRMKYLDDRTIGMLDVGDMWRCWTLEDKHREQAGVPVEQWKIHGATAIPEGRYRVTLEDSPRFGKNTLTVLDVPGFQYIRMHGGNTPENTEGCILVGQEWDEATTNIVRSQAALKELKSIVIEAINEGVAAWITIK